jgi:hypothetical protein
MRTSKLTLHKPHGSHAREDAPENSKVVTLITKVATDPRLNIYDIRQIDEQSRICDAITLKFIAENPNDPACIGRWEHDPRLRRMVEDAQAAKEARAKEEENVYDDS